MEYPIKSKLTWTVSQDTDRLIMYTYVDGIMTSEKDLLPQNGTMEVSPRRDTTYELVSFCGNILKDRKSLTIKVLIMPTTTPAPTITPTPPTTTPTPISTFKVRLYTNIPTDTTVSEQGGNFRTYVFNINSNGSEKDITYNRGTSVSFSGTPVIEVPNTVRSQVGAQENQKWQVQGWFNKITGEQLSSNSVVSLNIQNNTDIEIRYELVLVTTQAPSTTPTPPPPVVEPDSDFIYIEAYTNMMPQLFDDGGQINSYRLYNLGHIKVRIDDPLSNYEFYDNNGLTTAYIYTPNPYTNQNVRAVWATTWGTGIRIRKEEFSPVSITLNDAYVGEAIATNSNGSERKQFTASRQPDHLFNPSVMASQGLIYDGGIYTGMESVDTLSRNYINPPKYNFAWYDSSGNFYGNLGDQKTVSNSIKLFLRARSVPVHIISLSINRDPQNTSVSNNLYNLITHFAGNQKSYNVTINPNASAQSPHLSEVLLSPTSSQTFNIPFIFNGFKPFKASLHNMSSYGNDFFGGVWLNSSINTSFNQTLSQTWHTGSELYVLDGETVNFNSYNGDKSLMEDFELIDVYNNLNQIISNPADKNFSLTKVGRDYNLYLSRKNVDMDFYLTVEVYDSSNNLKHTISGVEPTTQMSVAPISSDDKVIVKYRVPFEPYKNFVVYKYRWGYTKNETFSFVNNNWQSSKTVIPLENTTYPTLFPPYYNQINKNNFTTDSNTVDWGSQPLSAFVGSNGTLTNFSYATLLKRKYYFKGLFNFVSNWGSSNLSLVDEDTLLVHNNIRNELATTDIGWTYYFDQTHVVSIVLAMGEFVDDTNPVSKIIQRVVNIPIRYVSDFQQLNEEDPFGGGGGGGFGGGGGGATTTPAPTTTAPPNTLTYEYYLKYSTNNTSTSLIRNLPSSPNGAIQKIKMFEIWRKDSNGDENLATNIPNSITLGNPIISNKPPGLNVSVTREDSSIYLTYSGTPNAIGVFETNLFMEDRTISGIKFKGASRSAKFDIKDLDTTDPIGDVDFLDEFIIVNTSIPNEQLRFEVGKPITQTQYTLFRVRNLNNTSDAILPNNGVIDIKYQGTNFGDAINFPLNGFLGVIGSTTGTQSSGFLSLAGTPNTAGSILITYKGEHRTKSASNSITLTFFNNTSGGNAGGGAGNEGANTGSGGGGGFSGSDNDFTGFDDPSLQLG
jgi:hypothetical protein